MAAVPVDKLDAQLVGCMAFPQELIFVDCHQPQKSHQGGDRCLANADGPERGGFDQCDTASGRAQELVQKGCGDPPAGAATDNQDFFYGIGHGFDISNDGRAV